MDLPRRISLLGIPVDAIRLADAAELLTQWLHGQKQHHVVTVNNEMLVESTKNAAFRTVLQSADLNVPDSTGVVAMANMTGQPLPERVPGVDLVRFLCDGLKPDIRVFLLGAKHGVAERAMHALHETNPNLHVVGTMSGSPREEDLHDIIPVINAKEAHLLLVAYGAPQQDLWISKHLHSIPSVRVAMGVGGTFDFLAGTVKRAPTWMRNIGLEWLWRLGQQPKRLPRIFKALIVFPLLVLRYGEKAPKR